MSNKDQLPTYKEIKEIASTREKYAEILKKAKVGSNFIYKNENYAVVEAPSKENGWVCKFEKYFDADEFEEGTQSEGRLTMKLEILDKKVLEGKMVFLERKAVKPKFEHGKEPVAIKGKPKSERLIQQEASETPVPEKTPTVDSLDEKKYREERKFLKKDTERILPLFRSSTGKIDIALIKKLSGSLTMSDKYANDIILELKKIGEIEEPEVQTSRGTVSMFTRTKKPLERIPQEPAIEHTEQEGETSFLTKKEIIDGKDANSLAESMRVYRLESGDLVYAGTDKGVGYGDHNEDRVVIDPQNNSASVIDGMGGMGKGENAAIILANNILENGGNVATATHNAINEMRGANIDEGGAVFISSKIRKEGTKKFLDVAQAGDCKLIVISKNGELKFESVDQSYVQNLLSIGVITEDEALYNNLRSRVENPVSPGTANFQIKKYPPIELSKGDLIFKYSDGLSDNFIVEEIIKEAKRLNFSPSKLFNWLSEASGERMRNYNKHKRGIEERVRDGVFPDGFKSEPKPDNRSLIIIEVTGDVENESVFTESEEEELDRLAKELGIKI